MKKLAIITTHPIQYNAPVFKSITERNIIEIKVFYTWGESVLKRKFDPGFKKVIDWDIPLLEGYNYSFSINTSKNPGSDHFFGIINPNLIKEIENWNADFVLVFGWSFYSHLKCIKYFKNKIPVFFRGDSTLLDQKKNNLLNYIRTYFLKWVYKNIDIAFYVGKANLNYYLKHGMSNDKLVFAPHTVDNERFSGNQIINYKSKLGINNDDILLLFAGKFEQKKNPLLIIDALNKINNNRLHLLFVGNGDLEQLISERIHESNQNGTKRLHLLPFQNQSEMPSLYQSADIFILPSAGPYETWGLAVNEAMAAGKAVIVSDKCGCHLDLVKNGLNGFIFHSNNIDSLVNAIKLTIENNKFISMGNESKKIISNWNIKSISEKIENTIISYN